MPASTPQRLSPHAPEPGGRLDLAPLQALCAAEAVLWSYDADAGRLTLTGAGDALGLSLLTPACSAAALLALAAPRWRVEAAALLARPTPGVPITARFAVGAGPVALWRGVGLEAPGQAAGIAVPQARFALAEEDALTGLLTRAAFIGRLQARLDAGDAVRLLAADVGRLRRLNDALGLERADLVLKVLASRLAAAFPGGSAAARIGEDEFAVVLEEEEAGAPTRLREIMEQPMRVGGLDIRPTLWIAETCAGGAAPGPVGASELLRRASVAVNAVKSAGLAGSLATAATPGLDDVTRLTLEADLHGALERGEIVPFFQPIAELATGRLAGFEALARWAHPTRGLLTPDSFLPLLAHARLLGRLCRHMIESSAARLAQWRRAHPRAGELFVSVNLATGDLEDESLVAFVADTVRAAGLPPRALKLEVTESDMMRDPERAAVVLGALRDAGAAISLDDFGTGFSSLAYLTRLPLETLKIDRYFVSTMSENAGSAKIVRSVASLGHDLGLEVIAEGVETVAVARQLLLLGCEYGQGYGYAPALNAEEAEVYLNESYLDGAPLKVTA